jgi:hypothetical protein
MFQDSPGPQVVVSGLLVNLRASLLEQSLMADKVTSFEALNEKEAKYVVNLLVGQKGEYDNVNNETQALLELVMFPEPYQRADNYWKRLLTIMEVYKYLDAIVAQKLGNGLLVEELSNRRNDVHIGSVLAVLKAEQVDTVKKIFKLRNDEP